jgi:hypothetical protein
MPSTHQSGRDTEYPTDAHRMIATKNDLTIAALIRGIRDPDRAQAYIDAEIEVADADDRDVRKSIIGACNRRKIALSDAHAGVTDAGADAGDTPAGDADDDTAAHDRPNGDDSDDADDPYPGAPRFDSKRALSTAVAGHDHAGVFTVAKPVGTVAGCVDCDTYIGVDPRDDD